MIEITKDYNWIFYTENGEVEINNNRNVDSSFVDIVEELYFIMALEKIDTNKEFVDKHALLRQLNKLDQKHDMLLRLKQIYYTEVQKSIDKINEYCRNEGTVQNKDLYIPIIFNRGLGNGYDFRDLVYFAELNYDNLYKENPMLFKRLFNAMIDIDVHGQHGDPYRYTAGNIIRWFELFSALKDKAFGIDGEVAWLCFLLSIFEPVCSTTDRIDWSYTNLDEDWSRKLNRAIAEVTDQIERTLSSKIFDTQKEMLSCYILKPIQPDAFDSRLSVLIDAIKQLAKRKEYGDQLKRYLDDKEKSGCIAIMHSDSKHYVALSGGEYQNRYSEDLKQILGPHFKVVQLNPKVRYYHSKSSFVTYGEYERWKQANGFDESKLCVVKGMFSCCERKLLTELYDKGECQYTIYVKKKVCSKCGLALKDFDKSQGIKGIIKYPEGSNNESSRTGRNRKNKLNEVACYVKSQKMPDESLYS